MESLILAPSLIEQVYARMVDAIAEGLLAPGERLTQEQVAERLDVSRQRGGSRQRPAALPARHLA